MRKLWTSSGATTDAVPESALMVKLVDVDVGIVVSEVASDASACWRA